MNVKGLAILGCVWSLLALTAHGDSQGLAALSTDDRSSIELACIVAKGQGPSSYHECLKQQLKDLGNSKAPSLGGLSSDDRSSVQLACIVAKGQGPASYHECLNQQLRDLGGSRAPSLSGLSSDDRSSIELACIVAKGQGPASYHECLNQQLRDLGSSRAPSLSGLSSDDRNSIELACIVAKGEGPASYHECLNQQLGDLQSPSDPASAARAKPYSRPNIPNTQAAPPAQLSNDRYYTNSDGQRIHSPAYSPEGVPAGATAMCADGTYSFSQHRRGTCSHHGGVARWY